MVWKSPYILNYKKVDSYLTIVDWVFLTADLYFTQDYSTRLDYWKRWLLERILKTPETSRTWWLLFLVFYSSTKGQGHNISIWTIQCYTNDCYYLCYVCFIHHTLLGVLEKFQYHGGLFENAHGPLVVPYLALLCLKTIGIYSPTFIICARVFFATLTYQNLPI